MARARAAKKRMFPPNSFRIRRWSPADECRTWSELLFYLNCSAPVQHLSYFRDRFGKIETEELVPNGSDIAVDQENKARYVEAYVDYYMNTSIGNQYQAFAKVNTDTKRLSNTHGSANCAF